MSDPTDIIKAADPVTSGPWPFLHFTCVSQPVSPIYTPESSIRHKIRLKVARCQSSTSR